MTKKSPLKLSLNNPSQDSTAASSRSVTLKRTVTIRVVVTDQFKSYMEMELNNGLQFSNSRLAQIAAQLQSPSLPPVVREKLILEQSQLNESMHELTQRKHGISDLKNGDLFVQGSVEGFVTVSVGDNLYEKLGGMDVVVKDGIVEAINPVGVVPG